MDRDRVGREVTILCAAAATYFGLRVVVEGSEARAMANAERLLDFESAIGIDIERSVQEAVVDIGVLRSLGDIAYVWLHWPLLLAVFAFLLLRGEPVERPLRNAMIVSGAIGVLLFAVFPVAPPRFLPGYIGTVDESARTHYLDIPAGWRNRFAAFPSFHVGWTTIACLAVRPLAGSRPLRIAAMVPAVLVALSVVTTANHYVVDAVVGLVISVAAFEFFVRSELGQSALGGTVPARPVEGGSGEDPVHHGEEGHPDGQPGEVV